MANMWIVSCWMMGHEWVERHTANGKTYLICRECDTIKKLD